MAKVRTLRQPTEQPIIHNDDPKDEETMDESRGPLEESGRTMSDSSDEEVEDCVAEDIARFEERFKGINSRYRLINRIGEGKSRPLAGPMQVPFEGSPRI